MNSPNARRRVSHMNEKLVVVLARLLNLEDDNDHLLKPIRKLQAVKRKERKRLKMSRPSLNGKKRRETRLTGSKT